MVDLSTWILSRKGSRKTISLLCFFRYTSNVLKHDIWKQHAKGYPPWNYCSTWTRMVRRLVTPFGARPIFRCRVSFRECSFCWHFGLAVLMFAPHEAMMGANPGRWGPVVVMLVAGGAYHPEDVKTWEGVTVQGKNIRCLCIGFGFFVLNQRDVELGFAFNDVLKISEIFPAIKGFLVEYNVILSLDQVNCLNTNQST